MKSSWQERHLHVVYEAQQTARQKILEANTRNDSIIHSIIYQERQYGSQETEKHKSAIDSLKEDHAKEIEGLRKKFSESEDLLSTTRKKHVKLMHLERFKCKMLKHQLTTVWKEFSSVEASEDDNDISASSQRRDVANDFLEIVDLTAGGATDSVACKLKFKAIFFHSLYCFHSRRQHVQINYFLHSASIFSN